MTGTGYAVTLLREGRFHKSADGCTVRKCNTILLRGPAGIIVVNPGSVWDASALHESLKSIGVSPEAVNCVICTDGRAEHVGCISLFSNAEMMIVGYDIQKRGDIFLEHDFGDGIVPYEFDEYLYVIGTPGQRGQQVSLMVRGWITDGMEQDVPPTGRIAITGNLFTDKDDASSVSIFDTFEGNLDETMGDTETHVNYWRRSRQYVLDRADWIIPAFGACFKVQPEFSSTPCVELA
ncbi:hypothetical protein T265_04162 [Opisthorchis viverrini]|uniref:Metallo-beta-lactamase domain-containing protein n=2 Tax=Opisthorchis viverrini TaxID=6198 RepID=A0A074ZP57_OPIVI|nr:hypothetical protein T265_04162 [Opisthorchis viverrini]KER29153.1 hypothetical protein T265_04162 [Opisthorchis viverrini]